MNGIALYPSHLEFFEAFKKSILAGAADEKSFIFGVEADKTAAKVYDYDFVDAHMDMVAQLAQDFDEIQSELLSEGKRLNIVIRCASELNDVPAKSNPSAAGYKSTFAQAREAFRAGRPAYCSLSHPRSDTIYWRPRSINFGPTMGTSTSSGVRGISAAPTSRNSRLRICAYFHHCSAVGKALVLSEMGGCSSAKKDNDKFLQIMLHELEGLQMAGISFKYVTIFLADKWGADAALSFLRPPRT